MTVYNDHLSTKFRWFAQFFMSFSGFFSRHVNLESGDIQDAPWPFKPVIDAPEATWSFSKDSVSHWVKEVAMKKVELQEDFKWPKHSRRRCINIYDDFVFFCLPVFESRKGWPLHAIEISAAHPSIRLAIFTRWCSPCFTIFLGGVQARHWPLRDVQCSRIAGDVACGAPFGKTQNCRVANNANFSPPDVSTF